MVRELDQSLYEGKQMTAIDAKAPRAGAPSRTAQMWDQANWSRIQADVKRLQVRIAKATREGRWGKVQALQHLLTRSHDGKILAVKRVTENRGVDHLLRSPSSCSVHAKVLKNGLSRMRGDSLVRFLGGGGAAMRRCYLTLYNHASQPDRRARRP